MKVSATLNPPKVEQSVTVTMPLGDAMTLRDILGCSTGTDLDDLYSALCDELDFRDYPRERTFADFNSHD